jgi:hypothetical protein
MSLSDPNSDVQIWRYMSAHEFCALVQSQFMTFRAYTDLLNSDSAEGRIPGHLVDDAMNEETLKRSEKLTFVSCWGKATHENCLMWKSYAPRGFAITTTKFKLLKVLDHVTNWKEMQEYPPCFTAYDVDYMGDTRIHPISRE